MTFVRKFLDVLKKNTSTTVPQPFTDTAAASEHLPQTTVRATTCITEESAPDVSNDSEPQTSNLDSGSHAVQDDISQVPPAASPADNDNGIDLYALLLFWKSRPQIYGSPRREASAEEYLLYGKTLMLWLYEKPSPLRTSFPYYFELCDISNPQKLQEQLLHENYFQPASGRAVLSLYTVPELKIIADSIGCSKSGKKAELLDRICNQMDEATLTATTLQKQLYELSNKGKAFLQDNYDYIEFHRHAKYNISLYDFNKNRFLDGHKRTFNDNAYTFLAQKIYQNCVQGIYHGMCSDYYALHEISLSEGRYDIALDSYLRSLYLNSCCVWNVQYCSSRNYSESDFSHVIVFTYHSAVPLVKMQEFYSRSYVEDIYNDLSLPPSFLTQEEFKEMAEEMINSISFDYAKYNQLIASRLGDFSRLQSV